MPWPSAKEALLEKARRARIELARDLGARYLEIRHHAPAPWLEELGFVPFDSQLVTSDVALENAAAKRGCRRLSLGISWVGDRGVIKSKEGYRAVTRPVHQYVHPIRSSAPAPGSYFEGFRLAKALWRRAPLPLVDWAGRIITHWVC